MVFIALILWSVVIFFIGAIFGSRNNEDLTIRAIKNNGSFKVRGDVTYVATQKITKDNYCAEQRRNTLRKTSITQSNTFNGF